MSTQDGKIPMTKLSTERKDTGNRKPVITVGGGRVALPGVEGSGHLTQAQGLLELIQAHPDVQSGKVIVQAVMPITFQLDHLPKHMYSDIVVLAGFSGLKGDSEHAIPKGFVPQSQEGYSDYKKLKQLNYSRRIVFVPDSIREDNKALTEYTGIKRLLRSIRNYLAKNFYYRDGILFGNLSFQPKSFVHYPLSPAITDAALAGIRAAHEKSDTATAFGDFASAIEKENPEAAQYIRNGIAKAASANREYKAIMVTGSSRGDFVAKKTLDLIDTLKDTAEEKQFQILPILSLGKNITGCLLDGTGIPKIGSVPRELYSKLRGIAALNIASTGANDMGEMYLLPTSAMFPSPSAQNTLRDTEIEALGNRITTEQRVGLKTVNTAQYNLGNMQGLLYSKPHGMKLYDDSKEILTALRDSAFMDKEKNRIRAKKNIEITAEVRTDLANRLIELAYQCARTRKI